MSAFGGKADIKQTSSMSAYDPKRTSPASIAAVSWHAQNPIPPVINPCCNQIAVGMVLSLGPMVRYSEGALMLRRKFLRGVLWPGNGLRFATAVLLFWTTAAEPVLAQTSPPTVLAQQTPPSGAEQAAPHYSMEDLS